MELDLLPNGLVEMKPIIAYRVEPMTSGSMVMRFEYVEDGAHAQAIQRGEREPLSIQLAIPLASLDQFVERLNTQASRARAMLSQSGAAN